MFFDQVVAFDHVKKEIQLIATADLTRGGTYAQCEKPPRPHGEAPCPGPSQIRHVPPNPAALPRASSSSSRPHLQRPPSSPSVTRAKEYIASGDVFQCVLSQRFDCVPGVPAFEVYRALRIVNPSPVHVLPALRPSPNASPAAS